MSQEQNNLVVTDKMSANELMAKENAQINFFESKNKPGTLFFTCGKIESGYVHSRVQEALEKGEKLENLQFAYIQKTPEDEKVACLFMGSKPKYTLSLGSNDDLNK